MMSTPIHYYIDLKFPKAKYSSFPDKSLTISGKLVSVSKKFKLFKPEITSSGGKVENACIRNWHTKTSLFLYPLASAPLLLN